ncbi:MAG TPA: glycosyltransferase [Polyangiales bacterium]|nr:glycosyltransferase [Polyangiales bacterium]
MLLLPSLHGGGAERVAVQLMQHLDRTRFEVRMGLLRKTGPYVAMVDERELDVARLGQRFLDFDRGNAEVYKAGSMLPAIVLTPANTVAMLRRFRPDVVVSFRKGMSVITLGAVLLYGRSRLRWVAREGNNTFAVIDDELQSKPARRLVRQLTAQVYRAADRLLSICEELQGDLRRDLGLDPARLCTIYNAVDVADVEQKAALEPAPGVMPQEPYLIAVGRLERQKGYDVLLHALAGSSQLQDHRLLLVGEGSQEAQLRALAAELGIADRVSIAGWQDNPWALMRRARLFVLPSRWEGFGNVVVEALASGVPVVVSDCRYGPKEIVRNGQDGLVVAVDDVAGTRAALERVLGDPILAARLAAAGKTRAREFDVPRMVRRYEALFLELAAELAR